MLLLLLLLQHLVHLLRPPCGLSRTKATARAKFYAKYTENKKTPLNEKLFDKPMSLVNHLSSTAKIFKSQLLTGRVFETNILIYGS